MPEGNRVNALRSTARSGANLVESKETGAGVDAGAELAPPHAASVASRTPARPRSAALVTRLRVVGARRAGVRGQRRVAADDGVPGDLGAIAATLGDDLHALRRDRDRVNLPF